MSGKYNNSNKNITFLGIISILSIATVFFSVLFWKEMNTLNNAYSDMNQIEFLSSSTQRLISIAQSETFLQKDVFFIGDSTKKALSIDSDTKISVLINDDIISLADEIINSWNTIESLLQDEDGIKSIDLSLARDAHFKSMTNLTLGINEYTKELNKKISKYQASVLILFFAISLTMLHNLLQTNTELRQNKQIASLAKIDTATGLYNRSLCNDLFKNTNYLTGQRNPAIIIIDLNDLKKTNDTLGHRAGDELILCFANVLKASCKITIKPPLIGRYGGDEFIIFFEDIESDDIVKNFLEEVSYNTKEFNSTENKGFKISYADGYSCFFGSVKDKTTIKNLFDTADEAMYANKIAGKRAKENNTELF